jgi:hypothetical protein
VSKLTIHEIEVLEMLAGARPATWGAWVSECLESLAGMGLCTRGPRFHITPAGLAALEQESSK